MNEPTNKGDPSGFPRVESPKFSPDPNNNEGTWRHLWSPGSAPTAHHQPGKAQRVSMEMAAGPAPALTRTLGFLIWPRNVRYPHSLALEPRLLSPRTATRPPQRLQAGLEGLLSVPPGVPPRDSGKTGGGGPDRSSSCTASSAPARVAPRGGPWAQRVAPGASDKDRDRGGGNPRVSQPVSEKGASSDTPPGQGPRGVRATRAFTHDPSLSRS